MKTFWKVRSEHFCVFVITPPFHNQTKLLKQLSLSIDSCRFPEADDDEDDMTMVSSDHSGVGSSVSESYCSGLLKKNLPPNFQLPSDCYRFSQFRSGIIRRDSKREDETVAFAGMDPGSAIKAMSSRAQGHPHEAQITRRLTSKSKDSDSSWF
jgi:hypothetical protein